MTTEEAILVLQKIKPIPHRGDGKSITHTLEMIAIDKAIKALEQQPCEDCISRQEAISAIQDKYYDHAVGIDIVDIIAHLPSVTPTKPTGRWIEKEDYNLDTYYECSECGESFCLIDGTPTDNLYNYCPNCGSEMTELKPS